ncbi:MAG: ferrous iron transport protein A [Endomicrobium sp.]|nr:ferrous iron transport protein A [Endomicrobium sp.]
MNFIKSITKQIYDHLHKHWVKTHFQKFKLFNKRLSYNRMAKLSDVVPGSYKFSAIYCEDKLARRLLEMGFVPNEEVIVIENRGRKGSVMVKIKGSKIALNHRVADKILLKRK